MNVKDYTNNQDPNVKKRRETLDELSDLDEELFYEIRKFKDALEADDIIEVGFTEYRDEMFIEIDIHGNSIWLRKNSAKSLGEYLIRLSKNLKEIK